MDGMGMNYAALPILDLVDLRDVVPPPPRRVLPRIGEIKAVVSRFYDVSIEDLESSCRKQVFARPRQIASALSRELTRASYPQIGRQFGGRDHTTILFAFRKIKAREQKDTVLAGELAALRLGIAKAVEVREEKLRAA